LDLRKLLEYCRKELPAMLDCLGRVVKMESPSTSKPHLDRLAKYFEREFAKLGGQTRLLQHRSAGAAVVAEFWSRAGGSRPRPKPILLLGHLDTVWDVGTLARMNFRVRAGRAYGPGVLDMKSGIVCGLWAIRALRACNVMPRRPIRFFLNSDEEISSLAFRKQILAEGRRARAVLVLEPAAAGGALKTSRKGVGEFRITVHGRPAHAGIDPGAGVNAISELARQLLRLEKIVRPRSGLTLSVGVVEGGTRTNVVPERARASIDVRVLRRQDRRLLEQRMYRLKPYLPGARLVVEGGINRPPLERKMAVSLFRHARELARQMDLDLKEAATGGGSDGNFTAAVGTPTLDGLGGIGEGAHALHEHVVVREMPRRAALVAAILATL